MCSNEKKASDSREHAYQKVRKVAKDYKAQVLAIKEYEVHIEVVEVRHLSCNQLLSGVCTVLGKECPSSPRSILPQV